METKPELKKYSKVENPENKEKKVFKILLAEDHKHLRESLKFFLEDEGYVVETVGNGQLLLDKLAVGGYDLVITDQNMPVLEGLEALKKIKTTEETKNLPVIVFSSDERIQTVVEKSGGIFCDKGDSERLFTTIAKLLENAK